MMPTKHIFVMGGREVNLGDLQHRIFDAGADGTMVGNYLTSAGTQPHEVVEMIHKEGLEVKPTPQPERWAFHGDAPAGEAAWNQRALSGERKPRLRVLR
jgi:biotin synthase